MTKRVTWGIYRIEGEDMYAILPDDGTRGLMVGDIMDVALLAQAATNNQLAGTIPSDHEQLGFEWLTIHWVHVTYGIPVTTLKSACQWEHIERAKKNYRGEWKFSRMAFNKWYAKHKNETRGRR